MPVLKPIERFGKRLLLFALRLVIMKGKHYKNIHDEHSTIKRILIIRIENKMGNLVMNSFYPRALKDIYPNAEVDFFLHSQLKSIYKNNPYLNCIFSYDPKVHLYNPFKLLRRLYSIKKRKYDVVLDCSNPGSASLSGGILTKLLGSRFRVGFARGDSSRFLNVTVTVDSNDHYIEMLHSLLRLLDKSDKHFRPELFLLDSEMDHIVKIIASKNKKLDKKFVIICVRAKLGSGLLLDLKNLIDLNKQFQLEEDIESLFLCSIFEKEEYNMLSKNDKDSVLYLENKREIAALIKKADLFVSGDGGLMHLTYALGTDSVVIFNQRNQLNYGYNIENKNIIVNLDSDLDILDGIGTVDDHMLDKIFKECKTILDK